ncbi:hypothetical protein Bca4012_059527 [Brassica carinata]
MPKGRLKLDPITNNPARNQTFKKRKRGFIKKVNELATLCGVKACAVINSCDNKEPEFFPSKKGAEEVYSKFKDVLPKERLKKMYDQERYLWERIQKGQEKVMKLHAENPEIELREVMFDLLKGKTMMPHHYYDPGFIGELNLLIGDYVNKLTHRTEFLGVNGESVLPTAAVTDTSGPAVGDVNPVVVGTEGSLSNPTEVNDHIRQYDGKDMSVNEQAPSSNDHKPRFNSSSQDMCTGLNHDQGQSSNQYPNSNESFMSLLMGQPNQMSVQDLAIVASVDDNNNYHQLPNTSQIPSTTTTTDADFSGHCINNKRWPTRFGLD